MLDLLTNATVVDDAIKFVSSKTVRILNDTNSEYTNPTIIGTGVIVTPQCGILTCYHVIFDDKNDCIYSNLAISFPGSDEKRHVTIDKQHSNQELDIALLSLNDGKPLPPNSLIAKLSTTVDTTHSFKSYGFKEPHEIDGLEVHINLSIQNLY